MHGEPTVRVVVYLPVSVRDELAAVGPSLSAAVVAACMARRVVEPVGPTGPEVAPVRGRAPRAGVERGGYPLEPGQCSHRLRRADGLCPQCGHRR